MIDDKVDEDYKKGYNLGYILSKSPDGDQHYKDLMHLHTNPAFRDTAVYKGLVNGRAEAMKERGVENAMPILTGDQVKEVKDFEHEQKLSPEERKTKKEADDKFLKDLYAKRDANREKDKGHSH